MTELKLNKLNLEVGKRYLTRNSKTAIVCMVYENKQGQQYADYAILNEADEFVTVDKNGKHRSENRYDLISEIKEESTEHLQEVVTRLTGQVNELEEKLSKEIELNTGLEILNHNLSVKNNIMMGFCDTAKVKAKMLNKIIGDK